MWDNTELFEPLYCSGDEEDSASVVPFSIKSSGILWLNCQPFVSSNQGSQCVSAVNLSHVGVQTPKGGFAVSTESLCSAVNLSHVGVNTSKRGFDIPTDSSCSAVNHSQLKAKKPKSGLPVPSDNGSCSFFSRMGSPHCGDQHGVSKSV